MGYFLKKSAEKFADTKIITTFAPAIEKDSHHQGDEIKKMVR